jgi:LysR family transcriptional regulator for bpeEF and oprC
MEHFRRISVFVRVAELNSFAAASAALGLTPSAVSKSIGALERDLKVRLLMRHARGVTLSEEGASFFARCKAILADLEAAQLELGSARANVRGRLRVMLHVTPARFRILPELSRFLKQHPELQLEVLLSPGAKSVDAEGIDVGVFIGDPPDSRLVARRVADLQFVTCASRAYLAAYGTPAHPRDLEHHNCIEYLRPDGRTRKVWTFDRDGESCAVEIGGNLCINDGQALVEMAAAGNGIAHLIVMTCERHLAAGSLVPLFSGWTSEAPPIYVLYAKGSSQAPRVRAFVDFVTKLFADTPATGLSVRHWPMYRS